MGRPRGSTNKKKNITTTSGIDLTDIANDLVNQPTLDEPEEKEEDPKESKVAYVEEDPSFGIAINGRNISVYRRPFFKDGGSTRNPRTGKSKEYNPGDYGSWDMQKVSHFRTESAAYNFIQAERRKGILKSKMEDKGFINLKMVMEAIDDSKVKIPNE